MLIKFNILWIEDKESYIKTTGKTLETYLNNLGFHLEIDQILDPENTDVERYLSNTSKYDLILVDWRFKAKPGETDKPIGGEIIERIRSRLAFADIIFYSGDPKFEEDFRKKGLEGVYLSDRNDLRDEAKALINYLLHKTLHPKVMRGIIVSELSNIDDICYKIIEKKYNKDGCDKATFARAIKDSICSQAGKKHKERIAIAKKPDDEFMNGIYSTILFDSGKRSQKVVEFAKEDGIEQNLLEIIERLPITINKRNRLAHWKRSEETNTQIKLVHSGKSDYIFDQEEAQLMRRNINEIAEALTKYLESI